MNPFDAFLDKLFVDLQAGPRSLFEDEIMDDDSVADENVVGPIALLTGLDKKDVSERIANLPLDEVADLIDAVSRQDEASIMIALNWGRDAEHSRKPEAKEGDEDLEEGFSIGDKVAAGKKVGVVKIEDGPGETAGVLIGGEMQMINKDKLKPSRVDENVLGMAGMPGLRRMQALAGLPQTAEVTVVDPQTAATQEMADEVMTTGPVELPVAAAAEAPAEDAEAEVEEVEDDGAAEGDEAPATEVDDDGEEGADRPAEVAPAEDPKVCIMAAIEQIEAHIRNLKVGEFKEINDRITKIQGSLFESMVINRQVL